MKRSTALLRFSVVSLLLICAGGCDGHRTAGDGAAAEFKAHPSSYKDRRLTIEASLAVPDTITQHDLDDHGFRVPFKYDGTTSGAPFKLEFAIDLPQGLPIPSINNLYSYVVTFDCTEGALKHGNVATSVKQGRKLNSKASVIPLDR